MPSEHAWCYISAGIVLADCIVGRPPSTLRTCLDVTLALALMWWIGRKITTDLQDMPLCRMSTEIDIVDYTQNLFHLKPIG